MSEPGEPIPASSGRDVDLIISLLGRLDNGLGPDEGWIRKDPAINRGERFERSRGIGQAPGPRSASVRLGLSIADLVEGANEFIKEGFLGTQS